MREFLGIRGSAMSLPTLFPAHDHCRTIGPYAVPPNIPGCRIGWDARMTSTWSWLTGRARKLSPMRTAPKQKPNAVDRARPLHVQSHLLSQMATDKHNSFESTGYGSAHNISADLSDQPCPAFLVLWTGGNPPMQRIHNDHSNPPN